MNKTEARRAEAPMTDLDEKIASHSTSCILLKVQFINLEHFKMFSFFGFLRITCQRVLRILMNSIVQIYELDLVP